MLGKFKFVTVILMCKNFKRGKFNQRMSEAWKDEKFRKIQNFLVNPICWPLSPFFLSPGWISSWFLKIRIREPWTRSTTAFWRTRSRTSPWTIIRSWLSSSVTPTITGRLVFFYTSSNGISARGRSSHW